MPPSELSLWANARRTVTVILQDMTTSAFLADWLVDKRKILFFALATVALVVSWIWRTSFHCMEVIFERQKLQIFLLTYATIYTGMVIAARTQYRWGEEIDPRHMVQIYWILWICMAVCGVALFKYCRVKNKIATNVLLVIFLLFSFLQINRNLEFLTESSYRLESIENRIGTDACAYLGKVVGQNQIVLSTRAELLRIHCDINARKIPPISQYDFLSPITRGDIIQIGQSSFLWGLVIEDIEAAKKGEYDSLVKNIVERPEEYSELQRVSIESPALILKFVGKGLISHDQVYQIPHVD
jgi:hypothetical protein